MKEEFKTELADILEVDEDKIEPSYVLAESEMWDSMTIVSVIALIDEQFDKSVSGSTLGECTTVGDIYAAIENA